MRDGPLWGGFLPWRPEGIVSSHHSACPPDSAVELAAWIAARLHEPSTEWHLGSDVARDLPCPVNLPGMHKAAAALIARYRAMPTDWLADVLQDFMAGWLLRPETAHTIARSAVNGVARGMVASIEAGIAWKLRAELLSQAHREYARRRLADERLSVALELAERIAPLVREAAARKFDEVVGL